MQKKNKLLEIAKKRFDNIDNQLIVLARDVEIDKFLNDLDRYPHAYVLACLMDRQIKAERAWKIPYIIYKKLQSFDITDLSKITLAKYIEIFETNNLHRFNKKMAEIFYNAIIKINDQYDGDVSKIWKGNPSSASVVYKFLEFDGCGVKISTMAANILAQQFRIPFSDHYSIDISPDVHVKRVMKRIGYVPENANNEMIIYKARELYPKFPGIIDISCWEIGTTWCKPGKPDCKNYIVKEDCKTYRQNST